MVVVMVAALVEVVVVARFGPVDATIAVLLPLESSFLLSGGEWLFQLAIDEEVAENAAGTPGDAVGPSLDARSMLFVDEDVSGGNEILAFAVMGASRHVSEAALQTRLEEGEGIHGGGYMAPKGGHKRCLT